MKVLAPLFADACAEAAELSFAVGVEHLVLALAKAGALPDVDPDDVRERILADQRVALASLGISFDDVRNELADRLGTACLPVRPETKRVLEVATKRRRELTPERLLVALRQHSTTGPRLLAELGV